MATANAQHDGILNDDELDAIINGALNGEDTFNTSNLETPVQDSRFQRPAGNDAGLGIDEEIKIVKTRKPIPKLDEHRLLSDPGIPKLRRISKERLKFKGKGHEYGDIARMLNMYQLWLDDLYPRAKFADGLAMIEQLGHKKEIQTKRKEWIDEGKPGHTARDEDEVDAIATDDPGQPEADQMEGVQSGAIRSVEEEPQDETDGALRTVAPQEEPDEDELDALLADSAAPVPHIAVANPSATATDDDPFADAMEAMAEMDDMW